jgi:hypothetical protein
VAGYRAFETAGGLGAGLRERVTIAYGVLKNRTPLDPRWTSRITR